MATNNRSVVIIPQGKLETSGEMKGTEGADDSDSQASIYHTERKHQKQDQQEHHHETSSHAEERDEVQEIKNVARRDTRKVIVWRFAVTGVLLLTAVAVTLTTYSFLQRQQKRSFESMFEQFALTVGNAATVHQQTLENAFRALSNSITVSAQTGVVLQATADAAGETPSWPFFNMPYFESFASDTLQQSKSEALSMFHLVQHEDRDKWVDFADQNYQQMLEESRSIQYGDLDNPPSGTTTEEQYHSFISAMNDGQVGRKSSSSATTVNDTLIPDIEREYYFPSFQFSPPPLDAKLINWNPGSSPEYESVLAAMLKLKNESIYSGFLPASSMVAQVFTEAPTATEDQHDAHPRVPEHAHSLMWMPIHEKIDRRNRISENRIVGALAGAMSWEIPFQNILPPQAEGVTCVIRNTCFEAVTYEIDGANVVLKGEGDFHERKYDKYHQQFSLSTHAHPEFESTEGHCRYSLHIYPSEKLEKSNDEVTPEIFAIVVASTFLVVAMVFFMYDMFVQRRNDKLVANAARSNAIVSSLFPKNIRDRLIASKERQQQLQNANGENNRRRSSNLKSLLTTGGNVDILAKDSKPLADLFLDTTVLFADIAGFTAWSSVREPSQVFTLLETVFSSFDQVAKMRRVFKVETVGDCYVAATGIPVPKSDHAIVMIRFARDILNRMYDVTKELEITLGPDTGDLNLRIGLHCGPVTAGVLRGERARFQLFGDTMNTASRIENTGAVGRIHLSSEAAEVVKAGGKAHWLIKREGLVSAKGKGEMQTYWIGDGIESDGMSTASLGNKSDHNINHGRYSHTGAQLNNQPFVNDTANTNSFRTDHGTGTDIGLDARYQRLVGWNVEMLHKLIIQIVARRNAFTVKSKRYSISINTLTQHAMTQKPTLPASTNHSMPLDEVQEIIRLPAFDSKVACRQQEAEETQVSGIVLDQLRSYVAEIARHYRSNAFHNFDHASHVTMSVIKLLSRIVGPSEVLDKEQDAKMGEMEATLHDHTYGITSDPLTQFACAFAALIHDVDHSGVPNTQLIKENTKIAGLYRNRSVAEQNSLTLAWDLLMMDEYDELRSAICATQSELTRFRQLVVNSVMATDISDKTLKQLRNARWEKAFDENHKESHKDATDRKATIVIEHLIQASDVAHTMQHWHVYRKWNERLFQESYAAYLAGRSDVNPIDNWYKGEIGFFDFYIIPLAKKLKDCGVFGISSDEYLNYALANRREWERRGREVVSEMVRQVRMAHPDAGIGEL